QGALAQRPVVRRRQVQAVGPGGEAVEPDVAADVGQGPGFVAGHSGFCTWSRWVTFSDGAAGGVKCPPAPDRSSGLAPTVRLNWWAAKTNATVTTSMMPVSIPKYQPGPSGSYSRVIRLLMMLPRKTVNRKQPVMKPFIALGAAVNASSRPTGEMHSSATVMRK